ncbi:MAG: permease-like cell division protein FtsX [Bacteroidales bacterium]|nr:permease-like cell division protein FtsX [Bacteroidales bacterium]
MRGEGKIIRRRIANAYFSSVISISLVLLLVGVASMLLVNTESVSDYFKENMQVSVLMKPEVTEDAAYGYKETLDALPFIKATQLVSRQQGEKEMSDMLGKDFLKVFETSPIPVSFYLTLRADYVVADSLKVVEDKILESPLVEEVVYQQSLVEKLNANLRKISLVLGIAIAILLFISFVLINNVMRLTVYERRFTVHTMRLVGATKSFIRGPFLAKSALMGLFSAFLAIIMLLGILFFVRNEFPQLFDIFRLDLLLLVIGIVIVSGLVICVVSTYFVVGKLVSLSNDELYY